MGAGAAGCLLANRLSADPKRRVLLIEAGQKEPPIASRMPAMWITLINSEVDWGYHTVPQRHCFGRRLVWPRGRMVGGSGATNALIYMRGSPSDYDRWEAKGATGWGWKDVLPWFRKTERNGRLGKSPMHGADGDLAVNDVPDHDPAEHLWVKAAQQAGLPLNEDFNSGDQYGVGFFQAMLENGERVSPADAFLDPVARPAEPDAGHVRPGDQDPALAAIARRESNISATARSRRRMPTKLSSPEARSTARIFFSYPAWVRRILCGQRTWRRSTISPASARRCRTTSMCVVTCATREPIGMAAGPTPSSAKRSTSGTRSERGRWPIRGPRPAARPSRAPISPNPISRSTA